MGCHTWFSVPYISDKEEIKKIAEKYINTEKWITESYRKMYQYAIDNDLEDPICELVAGATDTTHHGTWCLYKDVKHYSVEKYNKENGTEIGRHDYKDLPVEIETYSDEPRIGGYPDKVIKSYDEMVEFMKEGFTDEEGRHFDFYYDKDRIEKVMQGIKTFFEKHSDGVITFG